MSVPSAALRGRCELCYTLVPYVLYRKLYCVDRHTRESTLQPKMFVLFLMLLFQSMWPSEVSFKIK